MRQEHVTLENVDVSRLYDEIKKYMQGLKLDIIHEEKIENFWDIKAHKGTKGSVIIGNVRDVEVMISGTGSNYDLVLRTGAWGKDIVVPAVMTGVLTAGTGAVIVGGVSATEHTNLRKTSGTLLRSRCLNRKSRNSAMSEPVIVTH